MRIAVKLPGWLKLGPVSRISLGLVSLASCLLLLADLVLGVMPDEASIARQIRKKSSESLAVQLTALAQTESYEALRATLHAVVTRDADVLSIAVRRTDGQVVAQTPNHERYWSAPPQGKSTLTSVLVPISTSTGVWGQIEVAYKPAMPQSRAGLAAPPQRAAHAAPC